MMKMKEMRTDKDEKRLLQERRLPASRKTRPNVNGNEDREKLEEKKEEEKHIRFDILFLVDLRVTLH